MAAILKLMVAWSKKHGQHPSNILYSRDGVSSSQYEQLVREELSAFPKAIKIYAEQYRSPKANNITTTTVIVTKRHNIRFFPTVAKDAMVTNDNCYPGTLVDSAVKSPYFGDFYLQTQNAIKGTARPCHYFVITNCMGIKMKELQDLVSHISRKNTHDY